MIVSHAALGLGGTAFIGGPHGEFGLSELLLTITEDLLDELGRDGRQSATDGIGKALVCSQFVGDSRYPPSFRGQKDEQIVRVPPVVTSDVLIGARPSLEGPGISGQPFEVVAGGVEDVTHAQGVLDGSVGIQSRASIQAPSIGGDAGEQHPEPLGQGVDCGSGGRGFCRGRLEGDGLQWFGARPSEGGLCEAHSVASFSVGASSWKDLVPGIRGREDN
jgi:hypothetical protein